MRRTFSLLVLTAAASPHRGLPTPGTTAVPAVSGATAVPAVAVPAALAVGAAVARPEPGVTEARAPETR
ncbi:hypothetical protein GCM10022252_39870 [Streptosporangium oxazolinicum]|uniref:Uncharacterized protein n=1 Tax=Streptosporangium oxazolinicum TaxID=909287 RepID=A0ABP8B0W9_9ACTN